MLGSEYVFKKKCLIKQPLGIGDIIYCMKIAMAYKKLGLEIIWPVKSELMFMNDYISCMEFCDESRDFPYKHIYETGNASFETDKLIYVPLQMTGGPTVMTGKYTKAEMSDEGWSDHVMFTRNLSKEYRLKTKLGIDYDEPYCLVNRNYYPWKTGKDHVGHFRVNSGIRQVEMSRIKGFSVFDWIGIMENAEEIWTMDTCLVIMASVLYLKGSVFKMFIRGSDPRTLNTVVDSKWDIKLLRYSQ